MFTIFPAKILSLQTARLVPSLPGMKVPNGRQHGGRKPAETYVTEFCYKSVNLSLEELKNVTIILYSNTRTVHQIPRDNNI